MNPILAPEVTTGNPIEQRSSPIGTIVSRPFRRRVDDYFFAAISLLILGTVYLGFAHSYYRAGMVHARLPSAVVHIHAVVFSAWILLFIIQTALVSIGRVHWHKKLGILGAILAGLVVLLGVMAIVNSTRRHFAPPGLSAGKFLALDLLEMLTFATLVFWGLLLRSDGPAHKRLILLANIALLGAPVNRWPFPFIHNFPPATGLVIDVFLLSLIVFDLSTRRRIHRVTIWGSLMIFLMAPLAFGLLGPSTVWLRFTEWVQR